MVKEEKTNMGDIQGKPAKSINILIAEDSPTQAEHLKYHLEQTGYLVTVACNGREALELAQKKRPSMVISDVMMPEMNGYTLCKSLKGQPALKDVPVILLTSLAGAQDVLKGLECGADNFIRKPYEAKYLLSRVEYILANLEVRKQASGDGVQLYFGGQQYFITAKKQQILDLLISTYEGAIQINAELAEKQRELAHERDLLHLLMDNVPDWIYFKDAQSKFTALNRANLTALGLSSPEEAVGKTDFDFFVQNYAQETLEDEQRILQTGQPVIGKVEKVEWPDGRSIWLSTSKMLIRDDGSNIVGTVGLSRDITQSRIAEDAIRRANEELERRVQERTSQLAEANRLLEQELAQRKRIQQLEQETQARFHFLFANNPLPMWVYDRPSGCFLEVNDAAVSHYGYSRAEFSRLQIQDIYVAVSDSKPVDSGECSHRLKDGRTSEVEIISHHLDWVGHEAVLVVAHDITEQKRIQREFLLSQKMEAIGRLAAGVAHDFNNLLTVISGYSSFVLGRLPEDDLIAQDVREIHRAGERAASLTRQLLAFSKRQILQPQVLDLNHIVDDMDRMLRRLIGEDIELVTQLDSNLDAIKADPGQLEQVIMNLAVNARDAMPKGGRLIVETRNIDLREVSPKPTLKDLQPGSYVMMTVTDTGTGMTREVLSRVFDPFFTTKGEAGTGLGLSTVYGIVQQSGGTILVNSELRKGTTFQIYLPRVQEQVASPEAAPTSTTGLAGSETILVVEDEDAVRALISAVLQKQGYTLLRARNGNEALATCEEHTGHIDLMITDVVMPLMSGSELAARLKIIRPELNVLFMSGYTDDAIVHHGVPTHDIAFIGKPFAPKALAHKVREVLDSVRK